MKSLLLAVLVVVGAYPCAAEEASEATKKYRLYGRVLVQREKPGFRTDTIDLPNVVNTSSIVVGDLNADGSDEIIQLRAEQVEVDVYQVAAIGVTGSRWQLSRPLSDIYEVSMLQVNDDFCEDLLLRLKDGQIYTAVSNCRDAFAVEKLPNYSFPSERYLKLFPAYVDDNSFVDILVLERLGKEAEFGGELHLNFFRQSVSQVRVSSDVASFKTPFLVSDFSGDGKSNFLAPAHEIPSYIMLSPFLVVPVPIWRMANPIEPGGVFRSLKVVFHSPAESAPKLHAAADLNGDGRSDIVLGLRHGKQWWVGLSRGDSFLERYVSVELPAEFVVTSFYAGDFNGDGLEDILLRSELTSESAGGWSVAYSEFAEPAAAVAVVDEKGLRAMTDTAGLFHIEDLSKTQMQGVLRVADRQYAVQTLDAVQYALGTREVRFLLPEPLTRSDIWARPVRIVGNDSGPYVCNGYISKSPYFRWASSWDCPANQAYYSLRDSNIQYSSSVKNVFAYGACCRLPEDDILLNERVSYSVDKCPPNFIATGLESGMENGAPVSRLRCTEINTRKYKLGDESPGVYWGAGRTLYKEKHTIGRQDIPQSIRSAVGRARYHRWYIDGCIGSPIGSLVVRKQAEEGCDAFRYRRLLYRDGTPVKMFPNCAEVSNPFEASAGCVRN